MFPPQPEDPITQYGFVEGQIGCITLNFRSNPPPTRAWWTLEDEVKIDVPMGLANFSVPNQPSNYEAHLLKYVNGSQTDHQIFLRLNTITKQHAAMVYRLSVESILNGQTHEQEYTVYISVDPAPKEPVNIAIIVVMVVLVVIVTVIVCAYNTERWCLAGSKDYMVTGTYMITGTVFRVDEDNPGDIVKDEENISDEEREQRSTSANDDSTTTTQKDPISV